MKEDDIFTPLLLPGEIVLWSAKAEKGIGRKLAAIMMFGMGLFLIAILVGSLLRQSDRIAWQTGGLSSFGQLIGPVLVIGVGLIGCLMAVTGKGFLPPPLCRLTQRRVIIAEERKGGDRQVTARFVEAGRTIRVEARGKHFSLSVPVKRETEDDDGFMVFERLARGDYQQVLSHINGILGSDPT